MAIDALTFTHGSGACVRTVGTPDAPLFVLPDVCGILDLGNPRQVAASLDDDEVQVLPVITNDGSNRELPTNCVTEAGLYSLILRSRKPGAKAFKRWITHDVLPSIRKTGAYLVTTNTPQSRFAIMRQMLDQLEAQEARLQQNEQAIAQVSQRMDLFGADTGYRTIRAFAKETGRSLPENVARETGKRAAELCRQRKITVGDVPDERYGNVHSYPVDIIKEALNSQV